MRKLKILFLSLNLYLIGIMLIIIKKLISLFLHENAPLSARHTVLLSKLYETLQGSWSRKELSFLLLLISSLESRNNL